MSLLKTMLMKDEGCRLTEYEDSLGNPTIGFGHLVMPHDDLPDTITQQQAENLLQDDMDIAIGTLADEYPWTAALASPRLEVLQNMIFNLGSEKLSHFNSFLAFMKYSQWRQAHDDMLETLWAKQVKERAERLAYIVLTGDASAYNT